jgi:hypothetical protein
MADPSTEWNEVQHDHGSDASSDGEGRLCCPGKESIRWQNKAVYIQIREAGSLMFGTLSLRANDDASSVFVVWQPSEDVTQQSSKYAFSTSLSQVHSVRLVRPSLGTPQVIINLRSGCSHLPLYFHSGRALEFQSALQQLVTLTRCESNPATMLVNDKSNILQRSLQGLDLVHPTAAPPATRSRAPTLPSSPHTEAARGHASVGQEGEQEWGRELGNDWQWRYLQGGVCVMKSLRTGWSHASALAAEAATSAAHMLDQAHAADACDGGLKAARRQPVEDDCVWVEREPIAWQDELPLDETEFRALFDASGTIKDLDVLRSRAYYGGLAAAVRREGWKWLLVKS